MLELRWIPWEHLISSVICVVSVLSVLLIPNSIDLIEYVSTIQFRFQVARKLAMVEADLERAEERAEAGEKYK